jgi:hypothetical protein
MIQKFKNPIKIKQGAKFNKIKCNNFKSGNEIKIIYQTKNKKTEDIYSVINTLTERMANIKTRAESINNTLKPSTDLSKYDVNCPELFVKEINLPIFNSDLSDLFKMLLSLKDMPNDGDGTNKIELSNFNEKFRGYVIKDKNNQQCGMWLKILDFLIVVFYPDIPSNNDEPGIFYYNYYLDKLIDLEDYEIYNFPENPKVGIYPIDIITNSTSYENDGFTISVPRSSIINYRGLDCQYIVVFKKKEHTNRYLDSSNFLIQQYGFYTENEGRYERKYLKTQTQT